MAHLHLHFVNTFDVRRCLSSVRYLFTLHDTESEHNSAYADLCVLVYLMVLLSDNCTNCRANMYTNSQLLEGRYLLAPKPMQAPAQWGENVASLEWIGCFAEKVSYNSITFVYTSYCMFEIQFF